MVIVAEHCMLVLSGELLLPDALGCTPKRKPKGINRFLIDPRPLLRVVVLLIAAMTGFACATVPTPQIQCVGEEHLAGGPPGLDPTALDKGDQAVWCERRSPTGSTVRSGEYASWSPSGVMARGVYRDGKRDGYWRFWDQDGNPFAEGPFVGGKRHGRWSLYAENTDSVRVHIPYLDDQPHGLSQSWDRRGARLIEQPYVKGEPNGPVRSFAPEGYLTAEFSYSAGRMSGPQRLFFPNGVLKSEIPALEGSYHGTGHRFYPDGKKRALISFDHGDPSGEWLFWSRSGQVTKVERYDQGELTSVTVHPGDGSAIQTDCRPDGRLWKDSIDADLVAIGCERRDEAGKWKRSGWYSEWWLDAERVTNGSARDSSD